MIAVVVLAVAGTAITSRMSETFTQTYMLERRTLAHLVAENQLTKLRLQQLASEQPLDTDRDRERAVLAGRDWLIETEVIETSVPTLRRVEVSVSEVVEGEEIGPLDFLEAFVGVR